MSVGGGDLNINYSSDSLNIEAGVKEAVKGTRKSAVKSVIVPVDKVTAYIDPKSCVNCGTCREICPAGAIEEQQRIVERLEKLLPFCNDIYN